ncbi:uncharacterized protein LOC111406997 [Olea europaea var. sylvestris]|uniref:uncharacterized protein LOC111406997 n=1 Tax=Olea europaea var. sylvestris TaxID=158386 RepID=UPI000C1D4B9D|nr:uncharacterized protein LOC111406997 [Olea europaea var. sylvestris]
MDWPLLCVLCKLYLSSPFIYFCFYAYSDPKVSHDQLQENIDLFCRARNNINTVLNEMRSMPGIMSQMPPLSVIINEELASSILPSSSQVILQSLLLNISVH